MKTIRTAIELSLLGNISAQSNAFATSFNRLESSGRRSLLGIANAANRTHSALGSVFNRGTALIGSVGLGVSGKSMADLQTRLTRLRIQAGISKEEMEKFNKELYKTAQNRDINISTGELLSAIEKIVSKTGDMKFAADNMKNLAYAISATGAAGQDVGAMGADLMEKFGIKDKKDIIETMGLLVNQGKAGAFELRDLASQGERVTAAYASTGRMGKVAVAEMGAMLQMARKSTGSPEQTATALEALIRNFNDPNKRKILTGNGIKILDPEDPKRMRSIVEISKDLIKLTKGDTSKIGRVIDQEGLKALMALVIEYKQTGGFKSVEEFLTVSSDPQALLDNSKEVAQNLNSAMMSLSTAVNYFANTNLAKPVQMLADAINSTDPETLQQWLKYAGTAFGGLAAVWAGSKVVGMGASALAMLGGGKGGAASVAGSIANIASLSRPLPVFVVNSDGPQLPRYARRYGRNSGIADIAGSIGVSGGRWGRLLKATGRLGTIGAAGYGLYSAYNADNNIDRGEGLGMALGGTIGMLGGPLGVMIGTYAGQKIGGYVGGLVDDFKKAQNAEEVGKIVGRELNKLSKILPGGEFLSQYAEAAAEKLGGAIGQFFDSVTGKQEQQEEKIKAREQSTLHKISNEINLVIDDQGARLVRKNTSEPQQTKINVDLGYTRMPSHAV